jgi:phosphoglycerate dehydrogenase-like enzyme
MRVIGVKRSIEGVNPADLHLDALYGANDLHRALPEAQNLVLITPHTSETSGMIGARELAMLPTGAVFINIGRGALVDEPALIATLRSGHLLGAGLDVFATEPLPADSPLWDMENVICVAHSASTAYRENERITDLFLDNLRRFLDGNPMRNVFDHAKGF